MKNIFGIKKAKNFKTLNGGYFVISLDFELMWGVRDKKTISSYGENVLGVRRVIPMLLEIFEKYNVSATFATVGLLFCKDKKAMVGNIPEIQPQYFNTNLSPYKYISEIGENERDDKYHYASSLIRLIQQYPNHEIGTHTYCHYYCLEKGQTTEAFDHDIKKAIAISKEYNIDIKTIIFPRNQYNDDYLKVCKNNGIENYRGNEKSWMYKPINGEDENLFRRFFRLADTYFNISGNNTVKIDECVENIMCNIPSSRFLRPYNAKLAILEPLRLKRIKDSMTHAARNNEIFHLWWHPHNFGLNLDENIAFLDKILQHYKHLHLQYKFQSLTMNSLSEKIK